MGKEYKITDDIWSFLKPMSQEEIALEKDQNSKQRLLRKD
jgi:hypothetical protein